MEELMTKTQRLFTLLDIPALLPSILVAIIHFKLSVLVGSHANVVFQRWFDSGEGASGADAVIASVDSFLAKPIPTVFLAKHPVYGLPSEWWVATAVNSILWGAAIYTCYRLSSWLFKRLNIVRA
jgi:hypothetical protein